MWPPATTPCECAEPGWCQRHQCHKPPEWQQLCRCNLEYFQAWEEGQGLYLAGEGPTFTNEQFQQPANEQNFDESREQSDIATGPSSLKRVVNFGKAIVRHVIDAGREVDTETFENRIAVCRECSSCDIEQMICRHQACGCFLRIKAKWQSEDCPLKKWPDSVLDPSRINE